MTYNNKLKSDTNFRGIPRSQSQTHGKINLLADEQQRDVLCKLHVRSPIDYAITVFGPSLNLMQIKNVARMRNCPVGRMSHIRQSLNDPPQFQDMLKTPNCGADKDQRDNVENKMEIRGETDNNCSQSPNVRNNLNVFIFHTKQTLNRLRYMYTTLLTLNPLKRIR